MQNLDRRLPTRLESINVLRGAAALAVMLCHAMHHGAYGQEIGAFWFRAVYVVLSQGYLGVPLFFVISGFCIHLKWAKQRAESGADALNFTEFWKRRLFRLYPPYAVMLCLSMGLMVVSYAQGGAGLYPEPRATWMGIDFLAHLGMLHGFHPVLDKGGGNPPFWTLAREEYFYVMYFGLLAWRRTRGIATITAGVFVLGLVFPLLMSGVLAKESSWWSIVNSSAIVLWIQWCLGAVAVEAYYGLVKLPRWCYWWRLVPVWAAAAALAQSYGLPLTAVLWGMTFFTVLNCSVKAEASRRWPAHRALAWLSGVGVFSYSLYLVHNPVINIMKRVLGAWINTTNAWLYMLCTLMMAVSAYYAGRLFFILVERHFLNTRADDKKPQPITGTVAAEGLP